MTEGVTSLSSRFPLLILTEAWMLSKNRFSSISNSYIRASHSTKSWKKIKSVITNERLMERLSMINLPWRTTVSFRSSPFFKTCKDHSLTMKMLIDMSNFSLRPFLTHLKAVCIFIFFVLPPGRSGEGDTGPKSPNREYLLPAEYLC